MHSASNQTINSGAHPQNQELKDNILNVNGVQAFLKEGVLLKLLYPNFLFARWAPKINK